MIKAAFFDIDGTLLSHKTKRVSPAVIAAIRTLQEKGIPCIVATGRHKTEMDKLPLDGLDFDGYITVNGQLILDGSRQLLGHTPIQGRLLEQVLEMFQERKIPVLLVETDRMYVNFVDDHVLEVQRRINTPVSRIDTYQGDNVYQACIYLTKENEPAIEPMRPYAEVNWWTWGGADVVCSGSDKSMGIQKYLQVNGFTREECMAFGDGDNDVGMLRYAGIGVAVGNGTNEAKKAADYVTGDIDDGGIETALRHFGIL